MNIGVSYAKAFSNSIYGGLNFRVISESISNINALGLALDAGIQYVTGETENIKFGIALKNVGTTMRYKGDGLSITGEIPGWTDKSLSVDAVITKGIISLLINVLSENKPADIVNADFSFLDDIGLKSHLSPTRANGLVSMIKQIQLYARALQIKNNA